jgi:hypothetical protein
MRLYLHSQSSGPRFIFSEIAMDLWLYYRSNFGLLK